jgi:Ser/Thr protein kinase RdoA (MazF antagonist)
MGRGQADGTGPGPVITEPLLISSLEQHWGLAGAQVARNDGGMNSATWLVDSGGRRWVAKAVASADREQFAGGLAVAQRLEQAGIAAGPPLPAAGGQLAVDVGDATLAVLTWVPGHALTGQDHFEQSLIGTTLAQVHRALAGCQLTVARRFHWVDLNAGHLSLRPWLRPAIAAALSALDAAHPDRMTWGLLHTDPAPDAFRLDPATGRCGVIDWSCAMRGPLLYDLASAAMFLGGLGPAAEMIGSYLGAGVLQPGEEAAGLEPMLAFRWAMQASYFAWRIAGNNLTGISGPQDNEKGLADAQRFLLA